MTTPKLTTFDDPAPENWMSRGEVLSAVAGVNCLGDRRAVGLWHQRRCNSYTVGEDEGSKTALPIILENLTRRRM